MRARERERADAEPLCSCCLVKPSALTASFLVLHFVAASAYRISFSASVFGEREGEQWRRKTAPCALRKGVHPTEHTCLPCRATRFRRKRPLDRSAPHRRRRVRLRRRAIVPSTSRCPQQSPSIALRPHRPRILARRRRAAARFRISNRCWAGGALRCGTLFRLLRRACHRARTRRPCRLRSLPSWTRPERAT